DDVEPWVLGGTRVELVGPDEATRAEALNLQRLPQQDVLVVHAGRQHDQAAGRGPVDRVLERVRVAARRRWRRGDGPDRRGLTERVPARAGGAGHGGGDGGDAGIAAL